MKVLKSQHFNSPKTVNLSGIADTVKGSAGEPTDAAMRREAAEAEPSAAPTNGDAPRTFHEAFSEGFTEGFLKDFLPAIAQLRGLLDPSGQEQRRQELYGFARAYAHAGYNPRDAVAASLELMGRLETELAAMEHAAHPTEPPPAGEESQQPDQDQG